MLAIYKVWGMGWKATVCRSADGESCCTGAVSDDDAENRRKIMGNLRRPHAELDRTLVSEIEAAVGASRTGTSPKADRKHEPIARRQNVKGKSGPESDRASVPVL